MKKIIIITFTLIFAMLSAHSQDESDALRYSQDLPLGTARSISMSGAFGALGGDFSSIRINPAGLGVYRGSEFTITPGYSYILGVSDFKNNSFEDFKPSLKISNLGFVGHFASDDEEGWVGASFAIGYNLIQNYNLSMTIEGINENSSYADYFMQWANGYSPDMLDPYYEGLAYDTRIIDNPGGVYETPVLLGEKQKHTISSEGTKGEYLFAFGANYNHQLYFGASFTIDKISYSNTTKHTEEYTNNLANNYNSFTFTKEYDTEGTGYSFQFGTLFKPVQFIRLGASVRFPTLYSLEDAYYNTMENVTDTATYSAQPYDPQNDETLDEGVSQYTLSTPFKFTGSAAFIFEKQGLISIDYDYYNYSKLQLKPDGSGDDFSTVNKEYIEALYQPTSNIRVGGEYRIGIFALRGGAGLYQTPYKNAGDFTDGGYTTYSLGFGFREKGYFVDVGYMFSNHQEDYALYDLPDNTNMPDPISNNTTQKHRFLITLGLRF